MPLVKVIRYGFEFLEMTPAAVNLDELPKALPAEQGPDLVEACEMEELKEAESSSASKNGRKRLTAAQRSEVKRRLANGESGNRIAAEGWVSSLTVRRIKAAMNADRSTLAQINVEKIEAAGARTYREVRELLDQADQRLVTSSPTNF